MRKTCAQWLLYSARLLAVAGLAVLPVVSQASEEDPWESFNRPIFVFNDKLDTYALKPLAQGYQAVTPQFVEDGIGNFFANVGEIGNFANDMLQGKFHDAGVDTARFLLNSTIGVLGFVDVATRAGLQRNDEDFGQTFGVWGVSSGPYLMLPFFGPSNPRDAIGLIPDSMASFKGRISDVPTRNTVRAVDIIDTRADLLSAEKVITGDKYVFIRNAYLQNREFKVKDGQVEDDF